MFHSSPILLYWCVIGINCVPPDFTAEETNFIGSWGTNELILHKNVQYCTI